jgi:two-component system, NarL family, nitrate/nitrite response regulator NarL
MKEIRPALPQSKAVLIVEDNPAFVQEIASAVDSLDIGATVSVCQTGGEALALVAQPTARFDLALVDLGLPDINGIEIIRAVHRRFPAVPIMVISVASSEAIVLETIRAGARGYVLKGAPGPEMVSAIDEVLRGNYPITPALARTLFRLAGGPTADAGETHFNLTQRELETLQLIARGKTYKEVARVMEISVSTVQTNISNLYQKLAVHSQMEAVTKARSVGLI